MYDKNMAQVHDTHNTQSAASATTGKELKEPCRDTIRRFFEFFCRNNDAAFVTLCFMDAASEKPVRGYACVHCRVAEVIGAWEEVAKVAPGCTVHVCLNETNLKGRRTEHIQCVRVLCVDIDKKVESGELGALGASGIETSPDMVVQSSPGKFHLYWRIGQAIPIERWQRYQIGFAWKMGGDKSLSNATSMIRVPGFWRHTKADSAELFLPEIIGGKDLVDIAEHGIPEAKLIKIFPWLADAIKTGTEELRTERKKAGEWARKLWKEREKGVRVQDTPELGRNVTLYLLLKDAIRASVCERRTVDFAEVSALAMDLNSRFKFPLGMSELKKTIQSAFTRGISSGEAYLERLDYLKELPTEEAAEVAEAIETAEAAKEEPETKEAGTPLAPASPPSQPELGSHEKIRSVTPEPIIMPVPKAGNGHDKAISHHEIGKLIVRGKAGAKPEDIPTSFEAAGDKFVDICWQDKKDAARALAAAMGTKNYNLYATWLCERFLKLGVFRRDGVGVFVRGRSRWGAEVFYCDKISKEAFIALIGRVVTKIARRCIRHKICKQWVKKLPGQTCVKGIGEACWGLALLSEKQERQPGGVIVFQNGVLDLDSGEFVWDEKAAVKWSHALWCRFDLGIARKWMELVRGGSGGAGGVGAGLDLPELRVFVDYMKQWFPGDKEIVEVVLRWFGYCMTTDTGRNKFSFFYGPTRAGKGSICRTFCGLVGDVNYSVSDYDSLSGGFKAANFMDKLLICIEEVEGTAKEHEIRMGYLKKLLGGEKICVERKYEQPYEDRLVGKFVLQSNEAPVYQDKGHALRARMLAVGFERSFEEAGASVDPADVILGSAGTADALGTVAALSWWLGRKDRRLGFELGGCRALEVGKEEIVAMLDLYEFIVQKYLVWTGEGTVLGGTLSELTELVIEEKGLGRAKIGQVEKSLGNTIEKIYPQSVYNKHLGKERNRRGWVGLELNRDKLEEDFSESIRSNAVKYRSLSEVLGFKNSDLLSDI